MRRCHEVERSLSHSPFVGPHSGRYQEASGRWLLQRPSRVRLTVFRRLRTRLEHRLARWLGKRAYGHCWEATRAPPRVTRRSRGRGLAPATLILRPVVPHAINLGGFGAARGDHTGVAALNSRSKCAIISRGMYYLSGPWLHPAAGSPSSWVVIERGAGLHPARPDLRAGTAIRSAQNSDLFTCFILACLYRPLTPGPYLALQKRASVVTHPCRPSRGFQPWLVAPSTVHRRRTPTHNNGADSRPSRIVRPTDANCGRTLAFYCAPQIVLYPALRRPSS